MVTDLGRFLRKLRLDHDEIMMDMAKKLGVSAAFLSSVENGKKKPPASWKEQISSLYQLRGPENEEWQRAFVEATTKQVIHLEQFSNDAKNLMLEFARKVECLTNEESDEIKKILENERW